MDDNNNQIKNIKSEPGTNIIIKKEKNDYGEDLWGVVKDEKIEIKHEVVDTNDHKSLLFKYRIIIIKFILIIHGATMARVL